MRILSLVYYTEGQSIRNTYLEIVLMLEPGIVVALGPDPLAVRLVTGRDSLRDSVLISSQTLEIPSLAHQEAT